MAIVGGVDGIGDTVGVTRIKLGAVSSHTKAVKYLMLRTMGTYVVKM